MKPPKNVSHIFSYTTTNSEAWFTTFKHIKYRDWYEHDEVALFATCGKRSD